MAATDVARDYKGLKMRCAPGTHEAAAEMVRRNGISTSLPLLDIAAGSGALLARFADAGFTQLAAIELDVPKFEFTGCGAQAIDLNLPFKELLPQRFGLITAIEIVEHLDSPRAFVRELRELLQPDGYLLISTPNISNWRGRLKHLVTGDLRYFDRAQYDYNHHISPLTDTQMRLLLNEIGFTLVDTTTTGRLPHSKHEWLAAPVDGIARRLFGAASVDEVHMYLCRRAEPKLSRPGDWM